MSADQRQIRQRQGRQREGIDTAYTPPPPPVGVLVVELVKENSRWPDSGGSVYRAIVVTISGPDVPGADVTFTRTGDHSFQVVNLGDGTPPDPDDSGGTIKTHTLATLAGEQWVFYYFD